MTVLSRYWKLVRLDATGGRRIQAMTDLQTFLEAQFGDEDANSVIQKQLMALRHEGEAKADRALRCFISGQIEQVCIQLEGQFGGSHGFNRYDLLPLVLNDVFTDRPARPERASTYVSTAQQILASFDPDRASLSTWTMRLVKHDRDLNAFLLECGVYLLSDWAILNDTTPNKLVRVLSPTLTVPEVNQAERLLEAYHAVYRSDRMLQRQQGQKGACPAPTPEQLQRMVDQLATIPPLTGAGVLAKLRAIADRLRQHRVATRGGRLPTYSLDSTTEDGGTPLVDRIAATDTAADEPSPYKQFLQSYRAGFITALEQALPQVIGLRLAKAKPAKAAAFLQALKLFHCEGLSMGDIAQQVGLQAQFQVSRLLNLKALRDDVRHQMLQQLLTLIKAKAADYVSADRLQQFDQQIEQALGEQIDSLIQEAAAQAQSPKGYVTESVFGKTLCHHLDQAGALNP
jgi:HPt (histidine-containing phosphotransfer) domain-containing protein